MSEEKKINAYLFNNSFHSWLEQSGVVIGENVGLKFVCTIDINKLKASIMNLDLSDES